MLGCGFFCYINEVSIDYVLLWMVATSTIVGLVSTVWHAGARARGWVLVHGALLLGVLLGGVGHWANAGSVAFGFWIVLVVVPTVAARRALTATVRQDWVSAAAWARVLALFHPFDGNRQQATYFGYRSAVDAGELDRARALLAELGKSPNWSERARFERLRLDHDWASVVGLVQTEKGGQFDLFLAPLYLRALGEVGELDTMWRVYDSLPRNLRQHPLLRLQVSALGGLQSAALQVIERSLPGFPQDAARVWQASALQVAGKADEATSLLEKIAEGSNAHRDARCRLSSPLPATAPSSTDAREIVARFERCLAEEAAISAPVSKRPLVTYALAVVLIVVFALSVPGGSEDPRNLIKLGALVVPTGLVRGSILFRVFAAGFLHFGWVHLVMNLVGLLLLGRSVERLWNGRVLLWLFLVCNVATYALAIPLTAATEHEPKILLGASAGVMGLVGALATFAATGYLVRRNRVLGQRLLLVGLVLLLQTAFDLLTPISGFLLHALGFACGALLAIPLALGYWRRREHLRRESAVNG